MNSTALPVLASIARTALSVPPKAIKEPSGDQQAP